MAKNDREVLIKGTIPAGVVTKVFGVEDAIKELDLEARKNLIEREFKFGPRPPHGADRQSWDNMLKRNVPEHLQEYFGHLTQEPEEDEYVPFTSGAKRKRQAAAAPQSESAVQQPARKKKKKQQSAALLSFNMEED